MFEIALFNVEISLVKEETKLASSDEPSLDISVLVEKLTIPIFNSSLSFKRLETKVLAESKINSFLVLVPLTVVFILSELSKTNIISPVGLFTTSSFFTCNCKVTSLLFKSLEISFFSNFEFSPNSIVQTGSSTTFIVTVL